MEPSATYCRGDSYHEFAFVEAVLSGGEDGAAVGAAVLQGRITGMSVLNGTVGDLSPRQRACNSPLSADIKTAAAGSSFLCSAAT